MSSSRSLHASAPAGGALRAGVLAIAALTSLAPTAFASLAPGGQVAGSSGYVSPYMPGTTGYATNYFNLNNADLQTATLGGCDFMEGAFEETFTSPQLNYTRWDPSQMSGLDHCSGLAPAGAGPCTAMLPSMVVLNANFASYNPSLSGNGLVLRASQAPCSTVKYNVADGAPSQCCSSSTCAAWAGAHLVSQGCILYGVLELEAAFDLTRTSPISGKTSGAFYFTATYLVKSSTPAFDPSWNEIDIGMIEGPRGTEYHTTIFTAAPATPTLTTMDALIFDPTGPVVAAGANVKSFDSSSAGSSIPGSVHAVGGTNKAALYNSSISSTFHTYKVVWHPNWVAWMVDLSVYRNITFSIWRPQSIRQILRTNVGDSADPAKSGNTWPACSGPTDPKYGQPGALGCTLYGVDRPDAFVYIRRLRYTPLSAQSINDALTSVSMFAKYGAAAAASTSSTTSSTSATVALGTQPPPGGRHLLQVAPPSASDLALRLAAAVPGVPASNISVTITSYAIGGFIVIADTAGFLTPATWTTAVQNSFINGLDGDLVPDATHITVQSVQPLLATQQCNVPDATAALAACPLTGLFANSWMNVPGLASVANGVLVEFTVSGYDSPQGAQADIASLLDASGSGFAATAARLSAAESQLASSYIVAGQTSGDAQNAGLFSHSFSNVGAAIVFMNMLDSTSAAIYAPQVYAVFDVAVVTPTSYSGAVLASINSALTSGTDPIGTMSTNPPNRNGGRVGYAGGESVISSTCSSSAKWSKAWYGVGIAFLIAFGLQTVALGVCAHKLLTKTDVAHAAAPAKEAETLVRGEAVQSVVQQETA